MSDPRIVECLIHATADLRLLRGAMPDRRERIATAAMQGMLANPNVDPWRDKVAVDAIIFADALIAEFDKEVQP